MKQKLRYRVSLGGRRFSITVPLKGQLYPAQQIYKQVREALERGVDERIAYSLPEWHSFVLRRYERAVELYEEYKRSVGTPRADRIITPALPCVAGHVIHFFCASTSDKNGHAYTRYLVVGARGKKGLQFFCDCPDFTNRVVQTKGAACKHIYLALFYLRDRARVERY